MKHSLFKRVLSMVLCLLMVVSVVPLSSELFTAKAGYYEDLVWPVENYYRISTLYYYKDYKDGAKHGNFNKFSGETFLDIPGDFSKKIVAATSGTVTESPYYGKSKTTATGGKARYIIIQDKHGNKTGYFHLSEALVYKGQEVVAGQTIGYMGKTGNSTGVHLHFEWSGGDAWYDVYKDKYCKEITYESSVVYACNRDANKSAQSKRASEFFKKYEITGGDKACRDTDGYIANDIKHDPAYPTDFQATAKGDKNAVITLYHDKSGTMPISTTQRYISGGDPCTIHEVYSETGMCSVTYPGSGNKPVSGFYARITDFNISEHKVNREGNTISSMTAKYLVYPEWIYPGTYYEAYSGAVTSNNPLVSVTVSISSRDTDTKIVKNWKENDDIATRVVTFIDDLPIKPEEFAKLKQGKYSFKVTASCNKKIFWIFNTTTDEITIFESTFYVSKKDPAASGNTTVTSRSGGKREVIAIQAKTQNYNSGNTVTVDNNYNGVSSYPIGTYKVKVNTSLNVRKGPGTSYAKVSSYKNGTTVDVTATNGNWGYTGIGWICLDYATFVSYAESTYDSGANYGTGNYVVTTAAGLNCRKGVGTNSGVIKTLPHGTQFSVTETDGAWGYSPEHGGWLCLQYASYVSALAPSLPVPALPKLSSTTSSEIGVGEVISFKWDAVDTADLYNVKLIDANTNKEVQSITITGTNASFKTPYAGKFNVSVSASNSQHDGPAATLYGFTAKAPSTVTFKDWDGKVISTQKVVYGKDATAPATPSRVGYTFSKWDGDFKAVREDRTITATYTRNKYKVTFCDYDGTVIGTQDVYYGDAATAPKYSAPTGYSFVKWDTKFDKISKATTVKAVISWTSLYPLEISTSSAVQRNNKSYIVTSIVNNSPNAVNNARIIAVLKTKENKLLATVQSANLSLAKGEVKNLTLTASYEGMATKAEIFVVKADNENIPLAKQLTKDVDQGTAWSTWSTSKPPANALQTQSRTEYRSRNKEFKTSTSSTLSGYTLRTDVTNPSVSYGSWSGWSAWQDSSVTSSDVKEVKTQKVTDYNNFTSWGSWSAWQDAKVTGTDLREVQTQQVVSGYNTTHWWHYYRYANSSGSSGSSVQSNTYKNYEQIDLTYALTNHNGTVSNGNTGYRVYYNNSNYNTVSGNYKTYWYLSETDEPNYNSPIYKTQYRYRERSYGTKTQYSYRTRTKTTTYYFYKWLGWSDWSTTAVSATNDRQVETRTVYRYLANTANNIESTSGKYVERKGTVDKSYANRQALLFVMDKNGTSQFVGQTVIGTDGSYSFKFKTKDEPTVTSGDYKVMLSIEGTSAAFELEPIKAPVPEYKVKFVDYNGTVVSEQTVKQGEDASVPAPLSREGYRFIGWDKSFTNIQSNTTLTAKYEIKTFDVVFVDEINDTSSTVKYNYGDTLSPPEVTLNDAYNFLGWDAVINGTTMVKENMVVTAKFEKKMFTVDFLDFDGSLLESQTIEYGEPAIIPELENRDNYVFISWNIPGDTTYVTENMTIEPYFEYTETVATPTASIETGTYNGVQTVTLSCETAGAQIYYTTDGTDPLEEVTNTKARIVQLNGTLYTGPFKLDSSSQLMFTAVKDGMNSSDYDYKTLAINTAATEKKQYTVTIHYGMYDAENTILVNEGELIVLDEELENYGYTLDGIYSDAEYKNVWNLETDTVKSETDLYLKWSKNSYTVTFKDMNGNVIETQEVEFGEDAVAPMWNEIDGYIFTGWDTDYTSVIEDITVTATYVSANDVTSVEFNKDSLSLVEGQTETITATVNLGTDFENDALIWQSSDENIVIVDDNGKITTVAVGTATIFAISEDSGMSAQCEVTVNYNDPCSVLGHKMSDFVVIKNPDCTATGSKRSDCENCDHYVTETIAALGHNMGSYTVTQEATCTEKGTEKSTCSRCSHSETRNIDAKGHNYKDNVCTNCGKSKVDNCDHMCHKKGFSGFIWKILRFFFKLFKIQPTCECGVKHY